MTSSRTSPRPRVVLGAAIAVLCVVAGCKSDPPPGKLFDEDGSWELDAYDLTGSGYTDIRVQTSDEAFLLKFDAKARVVQTAMCAEQDFETPANTQCRLTAGDDSFWFCKCFAYAFVEDQMQWREFEAGETPPKVEFTGDGGGGTPTDDTATGGSSGGGTGAAEPGADTVIQLAEIPGVVGEIEFAPLPVGVFGSDGLVSRYRFQQRAPSLFDQVFNDPDGRTACEPCVP